MSEYVTAPATADEEPPHSLCVKWSVLDYDNGEFIITASSNRSFRSPTNLGQIEVTHKSGVHQLMRWHQTGRPHIALRTVDIENGFGTSEIELLEELFAGFGSLLGRDIIRRLRLTISDDQQHIDFTLLSQRIYDDSANKAVTTIGDAFLKVYPTLDVQAQLIRPYVPGPIGT